MKFKHKLVIGLFVLITIALIFYFIFIPIYLNDYSSAITDLLKNNTIKSVEESHPEWLDKPLNLFYINTSHNTYLSSYQNLSMTTYSSIENALKLGAKCIELDVHYKDNKLLVTHGNVNIQTTNSLEFDKCLDIINNYGFNNSDPIILCLELFVTDPIGQQLLKSTLINKFNTKLLNADYKTNKVAFHDNFRNLLNKIIVIANEKGFEDINDNNLRYLYNKDDKYTANKEDYLMMRIYPSPSVNQTLSINFDPEPFWKRKINMIALNFQNKDANLYKNLKKFAKNSYVLIE